MRQVVILGGGFGGLYVAQTLHRSKVGGRLRVTLVDRRNFHLFQPLLYQVATGGLSPGDIASPLRAVLKKQQHIRVLQEEAVDIDPQGRRVLMAGGNALEFDDLVVAVGMRPSYFGRDEWAAFAPALKTVEDALEIRRRVLGAFERAEAATDPEEQAALLRFVVVGGGPTGVELAGALAELAHSTLKQDFRSIDPRRAEIVLLEGADRLLPPYPESLSAKAAQVLRGLGVDVRLECRVEAIDAGGVDYRHGDGSERVEARTVLWGAGMQATELGRRLAERAGAETDRAGRIAVGPALALADYPDIHVIGDLALVEGKAGRPLPGVAPVAMQQGRYVGRAIVARLRGRDPGVFRYVDKGNLAVIGRNAAVADLGRLRLAGLPAWLIWVFVHIAYLIEYDSKVLVMFQWAVNYFSRKRGARLITGQTLEPEDA